MALLLMVVTTLTVALGLAVGVQWPILVLFVLACGSIAVLMLL